MKGFHLDPECREVDGLRVLILRDNSFPVAAVYSLVHTGSRCEADSEAGFSHFVEHMLFKGTERRPPGLLGQEITRVGGEINGFTTYDYTGYTIVVDSVHLDLALDVHGDAMSRSSFDPNQIRRERTVILEEIKLNETSPRMILRKKLLRNSFPVHQYGTPVIGYRRTVGRASREQLYHYYRRHYVRGNVTVVVAGDVSSEQVLEGIERHFAGVPRGSVEDPGPEEIDFGIPYSFSERADISAVYVSAALPGVPLEHEDHAAVSVLTVILGAGRCGRLYRRIQYPGTADSIGFHPMALKKSGLLLVSGACQPGRVNEVIDAVREEFDGLKGKAPDPAEIERAKRMVLASSVYDRETFGERAAYLSLCAALASPSFDREYLDAVENVTPDQLHDAARKYLDLDRAVIGRMVPRRTTAAIAAGGTGEAGSDWNVPAPGLAAADPPRWEADGDVKKTRLSNGSVLLYRENRQLPIVSCGVFFPAGSTREKPGQSGLASMTRQLMMKGAAGRSLQQTSFLLESLGIDMGGRAGTDEACLNFDTLPDELDTALALLRDAVAAPNFDGGELERTRREMVTRVRREQDSMMSYLARVGTRALWEDHPYGRLPSGEEEDILAISPEDVRTFHERFYGADRMVLAIVGDLSPEDAAARAEAAFGELPASGSSRVDLPEYTPIDRPIGLDEVKPWPAAAVALAWRVPSITSRDLFPLQILSTVLGNPFGSRVWKTIREERGLAYTTGATYYPKALGGAFLLHAGVPPRSIPMVADLLLDEVRKVKSSPITGEEMNDAQTHLAGSYRRSRQSCSQIADHLAFYESCGLGYEFDARYVDELNAVTAEDVMRAAAEHLDEENFLTLTVRPSGGMLGVVWRVLKERLFG
jgi:zinc protease